MYRRQAFENSSRRIGSAENKFTLMTLWPGIRYYGNVQCGGMQQAQLRHIIRYATRCIRGMHVCTYNVRMCARMQHNLYTYR